MPFGFTYDNIHSFNDMGLQVLDVKRDLLPPINTRTQVIAGMSGAHYYGFEYEPREIEVDIYLVGTSLADVRTKARNIADWLSPEGGLREIFFDDEPSKTYQAVLSGDTDLEQLRNYGQTTLVFFIPDPFAKGEEHRFSLETSGPFFSRNTTAYKADGSRANSNNPRYVAGKFSDAIMIEEGTTNLFGSNGFMDTDSNADGIANGWSAYATGTPTGTRSMDTTNKSFGLAASQKIERTGGAATTDRYGIQYTIPAGSFQGSIGIISYLMNISALGAGASVTINIDYKDANNAYLATRAKNYTAVTSGWVIRDNGGISGVAGVSGATITIWIEGGTGVINFQVVQAESKLKPTSFDNGTRANEFLALGSNALNNGAGTIEIYAYEDGGTNKAFIWDTTGTDRFYLVKNNTAGQYTVSINDGEYAVSVAMAAVGWHRFKVTWNGTEVVFYIDGVEVGRGNTTNPANFDGVNQLIIGSRYNQINYWNSEVDDLRISNVAISTNEGINEPLTVTPNTLVYMAFNTNLIMQSSVAVDNSVTLEGTAESFPIFYVEIQNTMTDFKITKSETGEIMRIARTLNAGDDIVIDHEKGYVTINGVNAMADVDLTSDFFKLTKGTNTFTFAPSWGSTVDVVYRERWK